MCTKKHSEMIEDRLIATHVANNPKFEEACISGNGSAIMAIIADEMKKHNLYTKGSKKFQADVIRMLRGQQKVSSYVGQGILMFVWNARLSGIGLAVK